MPKEDTQFKPGHIANPKGRPRSQAKTLLKEALERASKNHDNVTFLDMVADKAFIDKEWGIAVFHKLVPTLKAIEADIKTEGFKIIIERPTPAEAIPKGEPGND
jgi:glycerophosphoryl diester phosphodiesterase